MRKRSAIFLDRDGVLNREQSYITDPDQIALLSGAAEAVRSLNLAGWLVIVVTNQSAIARGYLSEEGLEKIHERLLTLLAIEGAKIDAIYFSPYHPEASVEAYRRASDCRKPGPGLLLQAARDFCIELSSSIMIGDTLTDIEAGINAGLGTTYLLRSGHGAKEIDRLAHEKERGLPRATAIFPDLSAAAAHILKHASRHGD
jgi:D-glycero-D-manno-heptose 1,7-bisphosphate phosphatase